MSRTFWSMPVRALFVCAALLTGGWALASFWFPFGWDQGFFSSVGDVIVRGGMPYRDGWEVKGPLAYYGFALAQELFGRHTWSIRILDLALLAAAMIVLAMVAGHLSSRWAGWWAAITYALWIGSLGWIHTIQPDTWAAGVSILGLAPLVVSLRSLKQLLFAGLMIGCAALIKPLYLGLVVVPLAGLAAEYGRGRFSKSLGLAALLIGAAVLPPVAMSAWFAHRDALRALVDVHVIYTSTIYAGGPRLGASLRGVYDLLVKGVLIWAVPVILAGLWMLWRDSRRAALMLLAWIAFTGMCVVAQGKFYRYHWVVVYPPLLIAASRGFDGLVQSMRRNNGRAVARILAGVAVSLAAIAVFNVAKVPYEGVAEWWKLQTGRMTESEYYALHAAGRYFNAGDAVEAAQYIRDHTKPSDGLAVFGVEALLNFLSGRANPTRFLYAMPLTEGGAKSPRASYRLEYMAGLQQRPPVYVVLGSAWGSESKVHALQDFPELETLLQSRYSLEKRFGNLDLYRRN